MNAIYKWKMRMWQRGYMEKIPGVQDKKLALIIKKIELC